MRASPSSIARAGLCGVEGALKDVMREPFATTKSVNVPPVSIPTLIRSGKVVAPALNMKLIRQLVFVYAYHAHFEVERFACEQVIGVKSHFVAFDINYCDGHVVSHRQLH